MAEADSDPQVEIAPVLAMDVVRVPVILSEAKDPTNSPLHHTS